MIPPKANRKVQRIFDRCMYQWRHLVDNYFITMHSDKTDSSFSSMINLSASIINFRKFPTAP